MPTSADPTSPAARVVITGIGVVSPNGVGRDAFARAAEGRSGISRLDARLGEFDTSALKTTAVAQVRDFDPSTAIEPTELRRVPRMIPMALAASREAMRQAGLRLEPDDVESQRQIGVALGTGGGGLAFVEEQYRTWFTQGKGSLFSITAGTHGNLSSELSIALRLRGPSHVLSTGCTSGTDAIGYAMMLIRAGIVPAMLAGGADAPIAPGILKALRADAGRLHPPVGRPGPGLPAVQPRPRRLRPRRGRVDVRAGDRSSTRRAAAPSRLAELAGYGSTCDAYHRVQIAPDVVEPVRAMELALADARVGKDEVGYVNLHGTGTELNDRMETAALEEVLRPARCVDPDELHEVDDRPPPGRCGAGGPGRDGPRPAGRRPAPDDQPRPTRPRLRPRLPPAPRPRRAEVDVALCNCIAFGSKNSAPVVKRP